MRVETDAIGSVEVGESAYWGVHTQRALANFDISDRSIGTWRELVSSLTAVKQAAARANRDIGALPVEIADAIDRACERIGEGEFHDQFVVGVVQGGAGTSTNMNANEVIANVALEGIGLEKGRYDVIHPIDHVNRGQSTNDVYPTAVKIALIRTLDALLRELEQLQLAFAAKGDEFQAVLKVGRTQLQDAVPMTVGQEFRGFATTLGEDRVRIGEVMRLLGEVNLGATAIGTGITAPTGYSAAVIRHLREITGLDLVTSPDLIEATSDTGVFLTTAGVLKRNAVKVSKICNDLRLLSSGPQAGIGELVLPARQAGSSIMPGKVNPVIPEAVSQVAFQAVGADLTVTMAAEAGQLQLNAFEPVIADSLLQTASSLRRAYLTLRVNCVEGIRVNRDRLERQVESNVGVVTALTPFIGYAAAAEIAKVALESGRPIAQLVAERTLMPDALLTRVLAADRLSGEPSGAGAGGSPSG